MKALASADGRITVGEWVLLHVSSRRLDRLGGAGKPIRPRPATVDTVAVECRELLGLLAWVGSADEAAAQRSFDVGVDVAEAELLRALAVSLGLPAPPTAPS